MNQAAKENQHLIVKQALAKRLHAQKKENEEKDSKIARLEADYLELSLILSKKNAERNSKGADNFKQSGIVGELHARHFVKYKILNFSCCEME